MGPLRNAAFFLTLLYNQSVTISANADELPENRLNHKGRTRLSGHKGFAEDQGKTRNLAPGKGKGGEGTKTSKSSKCEENDDICVAPQSTCDMFQAHAAFRTCPPKETLETLCGKTKGNDCIDNEYAQCYCETFESTPSSACQAIRAAAKTVTFYEKSGTGPQAYPIPAIDGKMTTQIKGALIGLPIGSLDIGANAAEAYDVFWSDPDGNLDTTGTNCFVTVQAQYQDKINGGGLNLAEVMVTFQDSSTTYGSEVTASRAIGTNALTGDITNAVDNKLQTHTTMGNTNGLVLTDLANRLSITIGFPYNILPTLDCACNCLSFLQTCCKDTPCLTGTPFTNTCGVVAPKPQIYSLAGDFSPFNPNIVWTYGKYTTAGGFVPFTIYTTTPYGLSGQNLQGWGTSANTVANDPSIVKNTGTTVGPLPAFSGLSFPAGGVVFGPYLGPTVARFTVPTAGMYTVSASFVSAQTGNVAATAKVYVNGVQQFASGPVGATPVLYTGPTTFTLAAGATIDFVVDPSTGLKSTQVTATVTGPA